MSYFPAALVSIIAHGVLILLVFKGWSYTHPPEPPKPPSYIKATLLDLKAQGKQGAPRSLPKPKPSKPKPEPRTKPEPKVDKVEVEKQRLEKRLSEQKAKQKQISLAKAKKENKEKAEKLKREKEKIQAEARNKKQQERERLDKQKLKDDFAKERERFEAELQADALAQQAEDDKQLSQSYANMIRQRVEQSWSRPPSARNGMQAELSIQLVPTGEIIDVVVAKSSGNGAFDRSAIQAVKRVRQFDEIKSMPSRIFEREYRKFTLTFEPQDLRQ
ncbi:MAG: colicin import membrane protein [Cellvibrionaceae bacterium]|jgi:colicin import membrane protein